jgi:hypothetical protein
MAEIEIPQPDEIHEKAENPFTRMVALFVAIYAVGLAFAAFGGNNVAKEMFVTKQEEARVESAAQQQEFNTWNQFQAKSIREAIYRNERERLEAEKELIPTEFNASPLKPKLLERAAKEEGRMKTDKDELTAKAKKIHEDGAEKVKELRHELAKLGRQDPYFDFAEVGFQLAIVLASVSMLAGKRWAFVLSLILAIASILFTINGFFLLAAVPGFEGHAAH